jgi:hypothetical protein
VDSALVPGPAAPPREVGRSPLPARLADPTGSIATSLATAIGATAEDNLVRRPSASWWQLEGDHCLLLAPDLRPAVRGLPGGVRECMPMAQTTTLRPNRHPDAVGGAPGRSSGYFGLRL